MDLMELETQRKDKERQEEEVMEEEDSCYRKWRGGVSLSEETLSVLRCRTWTWNGGCSL